MSESVFIALTCQPNMELSRCSTLCLFLWHCYVRFEAIKFHNTLARIMPHGHTAPHSDRRVSTPELPLDIKFDARSLRAFWLHHRMHTRTRRRRGDKWTPCKRLCKKKKKKMPPCCLRLDKWNGEETSRFILLQRSQWRGEAEAATHANLPPRSLSPRQCHQSIIQNSNKGLLKIKIFVLRGFQFRIIKFIIDALSSTF